MTFYRTPGIKRLISSIWMSIHCQPKDNDAVGNTSHMKFIRIHLSPTQVKKRQKTILFIKYLYLIYNLVAFT